MVALVASANTLVTIITSIQPPVVAGFINIRINTSHGPKTKHKNIAYKSAYNRNRNITTNDAENKGQIHALHYDWPLM